MENKILVYQDTHKIDDAMRDYRKAVTHLQSIVEFLKKQNISIDLMQLKSLIRSDRHIDALFVVQEYKSLPMALKAVVQADNERLIQELKTITIEARKVIHEESIYPVDFSKLKLINSVVSMTDEAKHEAVEIGSVYIDTDSRKAIYEKALAAKTALEDLQKAIADNPKKNVTNWRLYGITPYGSPFDVGLLKVSSDGEIELSGELFEHLV